MNMLIMVLEAVHYKWDAISVLSCTKHSHTFNMRKHVKCYLHVSQENSGCVLGWCIVLVIADCGELFLG